MNKKVSKTLAAVLSAAMAASAFAVSTGAAFAADNQISATVDAGKIGIVNNPKVKGNGVDLWKDVVSPLQSKVTFTVNGVECTGGSISLDANGWTADDNDSSYVDITNNYVKASDVAATSTDIRTVTLRHGAKITSNTVGTAATSKTKLTADVTIEVEVVIYPEDYYIVLPSNNTTHSAGANYVGYDDGDTPSNDITLSMNEGVDLDTFRIRDNDKNGKAEFWKVNETTIRPTAGSSAAYNYQSDNSIIDVQANSDTKNKVNAGQVKAQPTDTPQTGEAEIYPTVLLGNQNQKDKVISAKVTVDDTYKVFNSTTNTFTSKGSTTESADGYDVEGRDVIIDAAANVDVTVGHDAVLGEIKADDSYAKKIYVYGTTGNITAKGAEVNVADNNPHPVAGKTIETGDINADTINVEGTGKTNSVSTVYQDVEVGNLTGRNINITAYDNNDADHPAARGHVVVKNITIKRNQSGTNNGGLTLTAGKYINTMTLGAISGETGPYADSPFGAKVMVAQGTFENLGDLKNVGKVVIGTDQTKTANATVGTIDTGTVGNTSYVDKTVNESSVQVNAGSALTASKITTDQVLAVKGTGSSSITVPVDSFVIEDLTGKQSKALNTYLYVTDAKAGDVLYTGYNNAGTNFIFKPTSAKVVGQATANHAYNYVLESVAFDGIRMTNTSVEVGQDPATLTLAALPDSAKLPDGVTVAWTATTDKAGKQTVKLTPSADGMTCQVEATGYTADNINGGNNVVVTATLMKDGKEYTDVAASSAKANVTLTNKTAARPLTGISLNKTSTVMKPKETRQLTVSYAPEDTTDNKTVTWTSSDPAIATVDKNGLVTGVAYGKTTITAKVGDFTATCNVTISASGMIVKVTDLDGNVTECAPDGSTTVDIPQSTAYRVELTSDETINEFSYNAGNGKVGGTNTISVWNGTAGTYEAYAAGKPGEQTGFYVNGDKLFNMQVVTRPFVSDTTLTANVAVGKSYTFRITLNDKNAKFTFSTANGDAVATSYKKATYPDANGDYYCTVTTKQAVGNVGVYCNIDGKNYKVFAVNTRA